MLILGILLFLLISQSSSTSTPASASQSQVNQVETAGACLSGTSLPVSRTLVFAGGDVNDTQLYLLQSNGTRCPLTTGAHTAWGPAPSQDGRTLLYVQNQGTGSLIARLDLTNKQNISLITLPDASSPSWKSGSDAFAFDASVNGVPQVFVSPVSRSSPVQITQGPSQHSEPAWSPDGRTIALDSNETGNYQVYTMNADGSGLRQITHESRRGFHPNWSPDGTRIVYECGDGDATEICVIDSDGTRRTVLTNNQVADSQPAWSLDGDWVVAVRKRASNGLYDLVFIRTASPKTETLYSVGMPMLNTPMWMP
jgi:Tol biopolymer transport system component